MASHEVFAKPMTELLHDGNPGKPTLYKLTTLLPHDCAPNWVVQQGNDGIG